VGVLQNTNYQNFEWGFFYWKDEKLYKLWLLAYAQAFPNFILLSFVAPFPARMPSRTRFGTVSLGEAKKGTGLHCYKSANQKHLGCTQHYQNCHQNCASFNLMYHCKNWKAYWKPLAEWWNRSCSYGRVDSFLVKM